jgi:ribosomal protein S18 acetylase RimI-like enzyme
MALDVRLAKLPEDEDALVELQEAAFPYHGGVAAFKTLIREQDLYTFVLTEDGRIVGSMAVRVGSTLYYLGVMTHPDYRRQGYARRMIENVMHWWEPARPIVLRVDVDNEPARKLYASLGFKVIGEQNDGELVMGLPGN